MAAAHSGDCQTYMYSMYSWAWGCRCCVTVAQYQPHGLWNVYTVGFANCRPAGTLITGTADQCCSGSATMAVPGWYRCS